MPLLKTLHHRIIKINFTGIKQLEDQGKVIIGCDVTAVVKQRVQNRERPIATGDAVQVLQHLVGTGADASLFMWGSAYHRERPFSVLKRYYNPLCLINGKPILYFSAIRRSNVQTVMASQALHICGITPADPVSSMAAPTSAALA